MRAIIMKNRSLRSLCVGAFALLISLLGWQTAYCLNFDKLGGTMVAYGEIVEGDYQRFLSEYKSWDVPPRIIAFDSTGGNLFEAIAIANLVRISRIPVFITGKCYSSCAFIYLAAPDRQATGEIGLHRPYYDKSYFSGLNSLEAEKEYLILEDLTKKYLIDIGVEQNLIDIIRTTPSDKVRIFKGRDQTSTTLGEQSPFMEEWRIAKCGSIENDVAVAWCADTWIRHVGLNLALIDGFKEQFLNDPDAEFRSSMPGICHPVSKQSQELALAALRNEDVRDMLKLKSEAVANRNKCVQGAENDEVWSFFKAVKSSGEVFTLLNNPARVMVLKKYGL